MDISSSDAPWVVHTGRDKWLTNDYEGQGQCANGTLVKRILDWKDDDRGILYIYFEVSGIIVL